jgi:hypothetical protein
MTQLSVRALFTAMPLSVCFTDNAAAGQEYIGRNAHRHAAKLLERPYKPFLSVRSQTVLLLVLLCIHTNMYYHVTVT